jgi:hypothetical protein
MYKFDYDLVHSFIKGEVYERDGKNYFDFTFFDVDGKALAIVPVAVKGEQNV